ncbi:MAG: hypothetical protein ACOCRZ_01075 [Halothermotrichaceae bacterium]
MKTKLIILTTILLVVFVILPISAEVEIGGELKTNFSSIWEKGEFTSDLSESLELELFIPPVGNDTDIKAKVLIYNPALEEVDSNGQVSKTHYNFEKLYLRHSFDKFDLTVGRQPISWGFGSLINPIDYTLGAVAMEETTTGKFQDAVEVYIPFDWNSGLSIVGSTVAGNFDNKYGLRGRTDIGSYDLNFTYVREPEVSLPAGENTPAFIRPAVNRYGLSAKGDLGPVGVYSAAAFYQMGESDIKNYSYLIGGDYSYSYDYKTITMQMEYLNIKTDPIMKIMQGTNGLGSLGNIVETENITSMLEEDINLLLGNVNYPIDDFSSVSLMTAANFDDGSAALIPSYSRTLSDNLQLDVSGTVLTGDKNELFGGDSTMCNISLGYTF